VRSRPAHTHIPSLKEIGHSPYEWMHSTQSAQVSSAFEADSRDITAVKKFAAASKLKVLEASEVKRSVLIEGKIGDAARAFGVDLQIWEHPGGRYRGRVGPVHTPDSLRGIVEAVFGFDNRVMGRPYFQRSRHRFVSRAAQPGVLVMNPDGTVGGIGGTSATAPMWAGPDRASQPVTGNAARVPQSDPVQELASGVLRDVSEGDNGAYRAGVAWDACTGLGSPNGTRILAALKGLVK
jgi:subtilase family serine protease